MKKVKKYPILTVSIAEKDAIDNILSKYYSTFDQYKFYQFYILIQRQSTVYSDKFYKYHRARLKAKYVRDLLGKDYKKIIDIMINEHIVGTDYVAIEGKKCYDYWITLNFDENTSTDDLIFQTDICTDNINAYAKVIASNCKEHCLPENQILWENLNQINFDYNKAINWLNVLKKSGYFKDDIKNRKFNTYVRMITDMRDKKWFIVQSDTGRIFHNFNLIKRELRGFCTVNGQRLVELDLKSAQPFILATELIKQFPEDKNIIKFYNDVTNKETSIYDIIINEYIKMYGTNKFTDNKLIRKDGEVVATKKVQSEFNTKDDIKPHFLKYFYKGNNGGCVLLDLFKKVYPSVYDYILKEKSCNNGGSKFAKSLQTLEANIFIPACREIMKTDWCLPVHDSLFTVESNKDNMNKILRNRLDKLGYKNYTLK